ncbi:HTH-type transcriptional regulator Cmr [Tsuneonella dongtanensis]|uniref:HTH-type transcriptional regulator Cmr n=2 Tax=Tsuneonella dongtanensis TaxID=692370 RepID=A0A1B2A9E7_9SPHN|nr:HTH-type transcriptional regulator Cmr [Tsuneonella dongtanensis]
MLWEAMPEPLRAALVERAPPRRFGDGQLIQQKGEAADGFWLIEEGMVSVGQFTEGGDFRAVGVLGAGDSYGELAVLSGRPRIVDAVARGPAVVRLISAATFERVLAGDPGAMRAMLGTMAAQLQETLDLLAGLRRGSTAARAAALIVNLSGGHDRRVTITQQEIADLLGVTRATANAALAELEDGGLIARGYGTIGVTDPARLRVLSMR